MHQRYSENDTADKIEALAIRFQAGEFSETVYRASLFALGLRGDAIDEIAKPQLEIKWQKTRSNFRKPSSI